MKTIYVDHFLMREQNALYNEINHLSCTAPILARVLAVPLVALDVTVETVKHPLRIIEAVALMVINLFGAAYDEGYRMKDSLYYFHFILNEVVTLPVTVVMIPVRLLYQLFPAVFQTETVQSISYYHFLGDPRYPVVSYD